MLRVRLRPSLVLPLALSALTACGRAADHPLFQPDGGSTTENDGGPITDARPSADACPDASGGCGYVSYNPSYTSHGPWVDAGVAVADAASYSDGGSGGSTTEREIVEADIVKVVGDQLFALSAYRGLLVADLSTPDHLELLGRFPIEGSPFEMYVRDGLAYVMYGSFWVSDYDPNTAMERWSISSRMVVLDLADPAHIQEVATFPLPGELSDSRMVGNVVYVVTYENGWCWGCGQTPRTMITSLSVGTPGEVAVVDQTSFEGEGYSWGRPSISVTTDRVYVGGRTWQADGWIQVVDISDVLGRVNLGARIPIAGQVESRWQMSEHQGVLRVVTQDASGWAPPVVQTYAVRTSTDVVALARLELVLPRPERLMSVQFDGTRAYAITYQRTDPLFIIDLSDPRRPVQRGELQMPGWLYYMVPAGDRMYGLGYDDGLAKLAVSLFDVSDMDAPQLRDRVTFGQGWILEDQDRIHKAFQVLPELGLILFPYAGWSGDGYRSGIQLIDVGRDDLTLRGLARHRGMPRRSFMHEGRMVALSDDRLELFDITDRDAPRSTASLTLARSVYSAVAVGDHVAELVSDWWSQEARIDLLPLADPDAIEPTGSVELNGLCSAAGQCGPYWGWFPYASAQMFALGDVVVLTWTDNFAYRTNGLRVVTIDARDPAAPVVLGDASFEGLGYVNGYDSGFGGRGVVLAGAALVAVEHRGGWYDYEARAFQGSPDGLLVIDLSDPAHPRLGAHLTPVAGANLGGLRVEGQVVWSTHAEPLASDPHLERDYADRIDVSHPAAPVVLPPLNVPGRLVAVLPGGDAILTLETRATITSGLSADECWARSARAVFDAEAQSCAALSDAVHVLQVVGGQARIGQTLEFEVPQLTSVVATAERVFAVESPWYRGSSDWRPLLWSFAGDATGALQPTGSVRLATPYSSVVAADGTRVVTAESTPPGLNVYDDAAAHGPELIDHHTLPGYAYDNDLVGDAVVSTCGPWGVAVSPL